MPRRRRAQTAGLVYHVVNRAAKRAQLFECVADYEAFERVLTAAVARFKVALFAYCIMPNHWHFVLSLLVDGELSRCMHWLTTTHARRWQICRDLDGQGAVYQGRFKAIPVSSDHHFLWVCRYVERNPLRASLVERAEDWRWSSLATRDEDGYRRPRLSEWPVSRPNDWISLVNTPQTMAELEAFRSAIKKGEPFGDEEWKQTLKQQLKERTPRRHGRPRRLVA